MQNLRRIIVLLCCIGSSSVEALVSMRRIGFTHRTAPRALLFAHPTTTRVVPAYRAFAPAELADGVIYSGYQVAFVTAYIRSKRVPGTCGEWTLVERKKGNGFQPDRYSGRVRVQEHGAVIHKLLSEQDAERQFGKLKKQHHAHSEKPLR